MGILHSNTRAIKDEEEGEYPIIPDFQSQYISSEDSSPKLLNLSIFIYKALKGFLWKVGSIFSHAKPAHPLLPVQNPASHISTEPLLLQTRPPISSPITFDDEDLECDCELWCDEENYSAGRDHHNYDEITCATVIPIEENASKNALAQKEVMNSAAEEVVVVEIKSVIQERWIKHYSSGHRILLVGEGNFSFSACLALGFRSAPNIIATSLDSRAFLKEHYGNALTNIEELRSRGSKVMHKINATTMANHELLGQLKFDRIIFNFPYVGLKGFKNLSRQSQLARHQKLVRQFLENAREMIEENGEIHITHKTNGFHGEWRLVSLGRGCGLRLIEATKFNLLDYPGYNTKCGFGGNGDFNCNPSKTYKFRL